MADNYSSLTEIKSELVLTDNAQDDRLTRAVDDASRAVDAFLRVEPGTFAGVDSTKLFDVLPPNNTRYLYNVSRITDNTRMISMQGLRLPPLVTVAVLQTDENNDGVYETTWSAGTDYLLYPLNDEVKREVRPNPDIGRYAFPTGLAKVKIQGTWGILEGGGIPLPIRRATLLQALRYYRRSDSSASSTSSGGGSLGGAWANFGGIDPDVAAILRTVAGQYMLQWIAA